MSESDFTYLVLGFIALALGIGGPIAGIFVAQGRKQAQAEQRDAQVSQILTAVTEIKAELDDQREKIDRLIDGGNVTHDLIRNNTQVMEKVDATLTLMMQVIAKN